MKWVEETEKIVFALLIVFLPTQLGLHFWPGWSHVNGIRVDYLSPTLFLTDVLVLASFFLTAIQTAREKKRIKLGILGGMGILGIFAFLNTVSSLSPAVTIYKWLKVAEFGFLIWYVAGRGLRTTLRLRSGQADYRLLLIPIAYELVLAVWQFLSQSSIGGIWYFLGERTFNSLTPGIANAYINGDLVLRPYGTLPHPNVLGGFLAVILPLSLVYFLHNSRRFNAVRRLGALVVLGLGYGALLLSLSRVAIVVGIGATIALAGRKLGKGFWLAAIEIVLVAAFLIWPRFASIRLEAESITAREELASLAVQKWKGSPILGTGLGTFPIYSQGFSAARSNYSLNFQPAHNIYLLLLSETGVVGFLGALGVLILAAKRVMDRKDWVLSLALWEILLLGLFDHYFLTLQQGQLLLAFILGLSFCRTSGKDEL